MEYLQSIEEQSLSSQKLDNLSLSPVGFHSINDWLYVTNINR